MISLQVSKEILSDESLSKKRKWDDDDDDQAKDTSEKNPEKIKSMKSCSASNLQNHTQLPLEWQRCLDIKSGQIYFYNTRTHKRALGDPNDDTPTPMSLELELNLPCQVEDKYKTHDSTTTSIFPSNDHFKNSDAIKGLTKSPSWLTFEADEQEMVTAVCKKCYMLVMMSKSYPACPNCKFNQES
ncbi:hypothetical protein DH2020_008405 [Rehmannia glutinosa]|uniref:WW domain-containing protein n=1 Tax=Rehmannia glutinosa TaxID=99300 RepID=A0ABR0U0U9_REHGL